MTFKPRHLLLIAVLVTAVSCRHAGSNERTSTREPTSSEEDADSDQPGSGIQSSNNPGGSNGRGGIIDGNTGELITTEHNPWFIGKASVPYCVKTSDSFSLSKKAASEAITAAFKTWSQVFSKLTKFEANTYQLDLPKDAFPLSVATSFKEVTCDESPPLIFKLGIIDDEVREVLPFTAFHTVGFARRTSYDVKLGTGKGYVWIASDRGEERYSGEGVKADFWKKKDAFYNVVAHEIGHVLGMSHHQNTIMDAKLPARLLASTDSWKWNGDEYMWSHEFPGSFCGTLLAATEEDHMLLTHLFGIDMKKSVDLCTTYSPESTAEGAKYKLAFTVKDQGKELVRKVVNPSTFSGTRQSITGQYLRKQGGNAAGLAHVTFNEFYLSSWFKGVLEGATENIPISIDRDQPLSFALRVPYKGEWKLIVFHRSSEWPHQAKLMTILGNE